MGTTASSTVIINGAEYGSSTDGPRHLRPPAPTPPVEPETGSEPRDQDEPEMSDDESSFGGGSVLSSERGGGPAGLGFVANPSDGGSTPPPPVGDPFGQPAPRWDTSDLSYTPPAARGEELTYHRRLVLFLLYI